MDGIDEGDGWHGEEPLLAFGRERRLHARAYDYWVSLLDGRRMPAVSDLDPRRLGDFAGHAVLIELDGQARDPRITYLGTAIEADADAADHGESGLLGALLRRLPDILAYRAPVSFEAEFATASNGNALHRGILLPLAGPDGALQAVFGVISWRRLAQLEDAAEVIAAVGSARHADLPSPPVWDTAPAATRLPPQPLDQKLATARTWAAVAAADRTRGDAGLHAALGAAHDFLLASRDAPASVLIEAGLPHGRITPGRAVRLVFGDAAPRGDRLLYSAVLGHALRLGIGPGQLGRLLDGYPGGHAAFARVERKARRSRRDDARATAGRARLADTPALGHIALSPIDGDFLLLIARRARHGLDVVARVPSADPVTGAAIGRFATG